MTGWIHRDLGDWDQLRNLFHPDATIDITWFAGKASDFVDGSMKMGASDFKAKRVITSPVVTFNADKAIAETNARRCVEDRGPPSHLRRLHVHLPDGVRRARPSCCS